MTLTKPFLVSGLLCVMTGTGVMAQQKPVTPTSYAAEDTVIEHSVDEMPKAPYNWLAFLSENLKYPLQAIEQNITGKIYVSFVVELDGTITNAHVVKGEQLGGGLPEEAVRVIRIMPPWTPGRKNGKNVRCYFTVPIAFMLRDGSAQQATPDAPGTSDESIDAYPRYHVLRYIYTELRYPKAAYKIGVEGVIQVQFTIEKDGQITNAKIVEGQAYETGLPEEALRIINAMPKWVPKSQNGQPVQSTRVMPIHFTIGNAHKKIYNPKQTETSPLTLFDFNRFIKDNIQYPKHNLPLNTHIEVDVIFIVDKKGKVINPHILRENGASPNPEMYPLEQEALRLFSIMPDWVPATIKGKPVNCYYSKKILLSK